MSEYLVRWKFGPNSQLNHLNVETWWYQQFHPDKESAVKHYADLLYNASPAMALTIEIFQLVQLVPGQPEPEDISGDVSEEDVEETIETRNARIISMYENGYSRREISDQTGLSYQTIYGITRPRSQK